MKPLGKTKAHYWLAKRMAKAADVDLVAAVDRGDLDQEDWADMVQRCRGCADPDRCARWLDRQDGAAPVPDLCPNQTCFADLHHTQSGEV